MISVRINYAEKDESVYYVRTFLRTGPIYIAIPKWDRSHEDKMWLSTKTTNQPNKGTTIIIVSVFFFYEDKQQFGFF